MPRQWFKLFLLTLIVLFTQACSSDKDIIRKRLMDGGLVIKNEFTVLNYNSSGLTDYSVDIELLVDSADIKQIIDFIKKQDNYFNTDTINSDSLFAYKNKYPYQKGSTYHYEFKRDKSPSYEIYCFDFNVDNQILKVHYLDED